MADLEAAVVPMYGGDASSESTINDVHSDVDTDDGSDDEEQSVPQPQLREVWEKQLSFDARAREDDEEEPVGSQRAVWQLELQQSVEHARRTDAVKAEAPDLRPVSPRVLMHLQTSLAGPLSTGTRTVRLWTCAGSAMNGFVAAYLGICLMNQLYNPDMWIFQVTALPMWGGIGVLAGEYTTLLGRALLDVRGEAKEKLLAEPGSTESAAGAHQARPSRGTNFQFLLYLLKSPVSAEVFAQVERKLMITRLLAGALALLFIFLYSCMFLSFMSTPTADMLPLRGIGRLEKLLCLVGASCCWPTGMLVSGWLLFIKVPCLVVSDRIQRDARRVSCLSDGSRCVTLQQHDVEAVEQALQTAHEHTARLGAILQPLLELLLCLPVIGGSWWLALGCTDFEAGMDPKSPVHDVMHLVPHQLFLGGTALLIILGIWPLYGPGVVSTACDELVAAVRALAPPKQQVAAPGSSQTDCEAALEETKAIAQVHTLVQYAMGLNDGQGLGFTLRRKRIGAMFVNGAMRLAFAFVTVLALVTSLV